MKTMQGKMSLTNCPQVTFSLTLAQPEDASDQPNRKSCMKVRSNFLLYRLLSKPWRTRTSQIYLAVWKV